MDSEEAKTHIIDWMRERRHLREVMIAFPPGCYVKATEGQELVVPAPGHICQTHGYWEQKDKIGLWVFDEDAGVEGQCELEWLEFVRPHVRPEWDFVVNANFVQEALA